MSIKRIPVEILVGVGSNQKKYHALFKKQYGMVTMEEWPEGVDQGHLSEIMISIEQGVDGGTFPGCQWMSWVIERGPNLLPLTVSLSSDGKLKAFAYLDISTCHMTKKDCEELNDEADVTLVPLLVVYRYDEGLFVHTIASDMPEEIEKFEKSKRFSDEFKDILRLAREGGCWFVRFDRDGKVYDHLPKFEWREDEVCKDLTEEQVKGYVKNNGIVVTGDISDMKPDGTRVCIHCGYALLGGETTILYPEGWAHERCLGNYLRNRVRELEKKLTLVTINCKFCGREQPAVNAHLHDGEWVGGECCWDARLRATE